MENTINTKLGELEEELDKIKVASKIIQDAKNVTQDTINESKSILKSFEDSAKKSLKKTIETIEQDCLKKIEECSNILDENQNLAKNCYNPFKLRAC